LFEAVSLPIENQIITRLADQLHARTLPNQPSGDGPVTDFKRRERGVFDSAGDTYGRLLLAAYRGRASGRARVGLLAS
jgi:hypothetical protein